jgi:hypothetical protein
MLRIETGTRLVPEEVIRRAAKFFGAGGYGMRTVNQTDTRVYFEGGGGGVNLVTHSEGRITLVELISQEWDYQVKEFTETLPKHAKYKL